MSKKKDLPAMPFYFGDWRKAPEIRALDLDVRMIWFEMIGFMWESTERGYLTLNGKPVITSVISKMVGVDITEMDKAIKQLEYFDVFSRREDGAIFCRKMIRDEELRKKKAAAGEKGMEIRYGKNPETEIDKYKKRIKKQPKKTVITPVITNSENEIEYENEIEKEDETFLSENFSEKNGKVLFKVFIGIYNGFIKKLTGASAKIDASDGAAMKKIITYLKAQTDGDDGKATELWQTILDNWDKLNDFYKNQIRIRQINSNLLNIINNIKNPTQNGRQPKPITESDIKDALAYSKKIRNQD